MRGAAITIILLTITSQVTQATVNLKDASLIKAWTDIDGSEVKTSHLITRQYNSRSLSTGRFGFGWCSNLDLDLTVHSEESLEIDFCTDRQEFKKARNLWRSPEGVIRRSKGGYILNRYNGDVLSFDVTGRLLAVRTASSSFKLVYSFGSLVALSDRRNRLLHILSDSTSGRIYQIKDGNGVLEYVYSDTDLVEVKYRHKSSTELQRGAPWRTKFSYDGEHNLTRIDFADGTRERYEYDTTTDRLIGAIRRDGCREAYSYTIRNSENFVSSATESCGSRTKELSQIEFFLKTDAAGDSYLERIRTSAGGKTTETNFYGEGRTSTETKQQQQQDAAVVLKSKTLAGGLE